MDDDASTMTALRQSNADFLRNNNTTKLLQVPITRGPNKGKLQDRPGRGGLPGHVPEPKDVSDPNYRRKILTGDLSTLEKKKEKERLTMTKMDVRQIGKTFGYMARCLPELLEDQYIHAGRAVLARTPFS